MQTYGVVEVYLHAFLASALDRGESLVSLLRRFTPEERILVPVHCIGEWVGPRIGLDVVSK
jgi:hypothetical protein